MTQENKELLLKDLCARLPYKVICKVDKIKFEGELREIELSYNMARLYNVEGDESENVYIYDCKPYLFPMSSMTEEQKKEYDSIIYHDIELHCERYYNVIDVDCYEELHDFYHKNHLDYRNLIGIGLAIDATGLNIY